MASSVSNIRIEPCNVNWKQYEQETFDFATATAAGIGGKYVLLYSADDAVAYFAWFDENNTDTNPAVASKTAIEVNYAASASASAIATAFSSAVDAVSGFNCSVSGTVVTVTRTAYGECTDSSAGNAGLYCEVTKCQNGKNVDLGLLDGDIEVSMEEATFELTVHQTGATPRADLRTGVIANIKMSLKESDNPLRKQMFKHTAGGTYTPSGGSEVFGWGDLKQGLNTVIDAGRLILHPVALSNSDYTRDMCFWLAYPLISGITFSGENPEMMSIEFKCYLDSTKPEQVNLFMFGDHTQAEFNPV
jgi:hypothetical protein